MITFAIKSSAQKASSRMTPSVTMSIRRLDPLETKMAQKKAEILEQQQEAKGPQKRESLQKDLEAPKYSTPDQFQQIVHEKRVQGAPDADHGHNPTNWQKKLLVLTQLYPSKSEIPQYVHHGTMNRMHDRVRALVVVTATVLFVSTLFISRRSTIAQVANDSSVVPLKRE